VDRVARVLFVLALSGGIIGMLVHAETVRAWEAHLAVWWMDPWIERGATAFEDTYMVWIGEDHLVGFQVTAECTAIILLAPLLALGAALMLSTRVAWLRGVIGITASALVVVLVNQVRLALIGWTTQQGGLEAGYEFGHRFAGSVVGIAGFAAGVIVLLAVTGVRRRRRGRE
jgi:exosortase/archaeosortase family protein